MKKTVKINIDEELKKAIHTASKLYFEGGVFVYPTDTIYGFGANPFNEDALAKITAMKRRSLGKKFILLASDLEMVLKYVELRDESHADLLLSLWPNPVSIVLKLNSYYRDITGEENSAFRVPNHGFCRKLLTELNMPLVSTSVNRSEEPPLNDYSLISQEFSGELDAIFYTSKPPLNIASTVIDLTGDEPKLLRQGMISIEEILGKYNSR